MNSQYDPSQNLTFSQRHGYVDLPQPMQLENIANDLRREIWNAFRELLLSHRKSGFAYYFGDEARRFIERVLGKVYKKAEDEIDTAYEDVNFSCKRLILHGRFNQVLDFLEIIVSDRFPAGGFADRIKILFEKYAAPYFLNTSQQPFQFYPHSSKEQSDATRAAIATLQECRMDGATTHLRDAAQHIRQQQYADSVSDSISAVESVARRIDPKSNTLGAALKALERKGLLTNKQLKSGFEKIYAYTNTEEGVRHAQVFKESPEVGLDEAMFMFGACASFAAFLVSKHRQLDPGANRDS